MELKELNAEIKTGTMSGSYFLYGAEDYTKRSKLIEICRKAISDDKDIMELNCYNFFVSGREDLNQEKSKRIRDALDMLPIMNDKKIVITEVPSLDSLDEKGKKLLLDFADGVDEYTIFVVFAYASGFDSGTAKVPSAFLKSAQKLMKCVEFPLITDDRELKKWVDKRLLAYGVEITPQAYGDMIKKCGRGMYTLVGEIDKLGAFVASGGRKEATREDIEKCVTKNEEEEAFKFANCILAGDARGAYECLGIKKKSDNKKSTALEVLGQINRVFADLSVAAAFIADGRDRRDYAKTMKMNEYRASLYYSAAMKKPLSFYADAMKRAAETDMQLKSGNMSFVPIERMIAVLTKA